MKVLSIKQPWASLIVCGAKRIEIRSWTTDYRGPLIIHASSSAVSGPFYEQLIDDGLEEILERAGLGSKEAVQALPRSAIVGQVTLSEILTPEQLHDTASADDARFTGLPDADRFYWKLDEPITIKPVHGVNGRLNLWSPNTALAATIGQALKSSTPGGYKPTRAGKAPAEWSEYELELLTPSAALAAIVGVEPLTREATVQRVWNYIVEHDLRDPVNERTIKPNRVLGRVLGHSPIDLFEMTSTLAKHLGSPDE